MLTMADQRSRQEAAEVKEEEEEVEDKEDREPAAALDQTLEAVDHQTHTMEAAAAVAEARAGRQDGQEPVYGQAAEHQGRRLESYPHATPQTTPWAVTI